MINLVRSAAEQKAKEDGASPEEICWAGAAAVDVFFERLLGRVDPLPNRLIIISTPAQGKTTSAHACILKARAANVRKEGE